MKLGIEFEKQVHRKIITDVAGLEQFECLDPDLFEKRYFIGCDTLAGQFDRLHFESDPQVEQVSYGLLIQLDHPHPALGQSFRQAILFEPAESLPNRSPARIERLRDLHLGKAVAGVYLTFNYIPSEQFIDLVGNRPRMVRQTARM